MTTLHHSGTVAPATPYFDRAGFGLLIAGGAAFFVSGPLHPTGTDEGDKTEQLHSMLVDPAWYPAHLVALVGFACVAAGLLSLGRDAVIRAHYQHLLAAGKPKKLALTACMRKLLTILNAVVKSGTRWNEALAVAHA